MRRLSLTLFAPALVAAALLTACGGGGGGGGTSAPLPAPTTSTTATPVPPPTVSASPAPGATATVTGTYGPIPAISATPIAITPASGNTAISITNVNGITGALALGRVDPQDGLGTSYTVTLSNAPYPGVPDFAATTPGVKGELLYLLASPPAGVNYLGGGTLTVNLPPQYQGASKYYIGLYITGPQIAPAWPTPSNGNLGVINGSQVTFTFSQLLLSPGYQYSIVLYAV